MSTTTTLKMRVQSKIDTLANWTKNNPVLLSGEVAYVVIPADSDAVAQEPVTLSKVGDGAKSFNDLEFTGALAADVHAWAKGENKPEYTATEIDGLETYIADKVEDTDTQYRMNKVDDVTYTLQSKTLKGDWADVENSTIVIPDTDTTAIEADIAENKAAIATLNGAGEGSVAKTVADAVAAIVGGADEKFDTLKEVADWLLSDSSGALQMQNAIAALETLVGDTAVATQIATAITSALEVDGVDKYALASELTTATESVTALEESLSAVATSGDIADLTQGEGYVIFSCGSSSDVI